MDQDLLSGLFTGRSDKAMRRRSGERRKKECGICDARSPSQGPTLRVWRTPTFLDRLPERRSAPPPGNRTAQLGRSGLEAFGLSKLRRRLASKAEALDQGLVAARVIPPEVIEEPSALAHDLEQAAAGMMILLVDLEVFGEFVDAFGEERNLNLR